MNVAFNYIKFASYSAIPFVVVLTLNVAVIYRTLRVSPNLRRTFGGELTAARDKSSSTRQRGRAVEATAVQVSGWQGDRGHSLDEPQWIMASAANLVVIHDYADQCSTRHYSITGTLAQ